MTRSAPATLDAARFEYLLRLADNGLVLAQRLGEWVGKGPVLEEDIASTNVGLDLLGQARLWLAYAGEVEAAGGSPLRSEDDLAYFRDSADFRNLLLVEQPNGNYADTIARQFLFDQWHVLLLGQLTLSRDERIAFQTALAKLGFDPGKIDGVLGRGVKMALRRYQKARGIPADGFPTLVLLTALLLEVRQKQL